MIKGEDNGVLNCRLFDSNGTLLGSANKRIKVMSSAVWDPVLIHPVRVNRDCTYRIIVSTSHRAYFHLGINLSSFYCLVQSVSYSIFEIFAGKASPVVYSGVVEFNFSTNDMAKDGLVRGFLFSQ